MYRFQLNQILQRVVTVILLILFAPFLTQSAYAERLNAPASTQLIVDTFVDYNDLTHQACTDAPDDCSLRGAISRANEDTGWFYEIILSPITYTLSISGTNEDANATGDLDILSSMALTGAGANGTVIDAQAIDRVFQIHPGASLTIRGVTITGGEVSSGGGLYNNGSLFLRESQVIRNNLGCGLAGGGIYNTGLLEISHSQIKENGTMYCDLFGSPGGGIYNSQQAILSDSLIENNRTSDGPWGQCNIKHCGPLPGPGGDGGGIYNSGSLSLYNVTFHGNTTGRGGLMSGIGQAGSGGSGGGLYNIGIAEVRNSPFLENRTGSGGDSSDYGGPGGLGGGIYNSGSLSLTYSPVVSNTTGSGGDSCCGGGPAGGAGGGIYNSGGISLAYSPVVSNSTGGGGGDSGSGGPGGGIYNSGGISLAYSPVVSNTTGGGGSYSGSGGAGGGIYNSGDISLTYSPVVRNSTGQYVGSDERGGDGGGIYDNGHNLNLLSVVVYQNKTGQGGDGGGIYSQSTDETPQLNNVIVVENSVGPDGRGSGVYLGSSATMVHTTLARNTGGDGSGIYLMGSTLTLTNTILVSQTVGITASLASSVLLDSTLWGSGAWANISDWGGSGTFTSTHDYYGDPSFVDPANGDYHILPSSPTIDQGVWTATYVDIDNQPRPNPSTGIPDLGADEYWLFVPISQVSISGQFLITMTQEVTYTAIISPANATPNFTYNWSPLPDKGNWMDTAVFKFPLPGNYSITVTAWNTGSRATATQTVIVIFGPHPMFLPLVMWKGLLSP